MKRALAVDGGNSKTDVVLIAADGQVLGFARRRASSPITWGSREPSRSSPT